MRNGKRRMAYAYVAGIHLLLALVLLKSDFVERVGVKLGLAEPPVSRNTYYIGTLGQDYVERSSTMHEGDGLIFIGDSITSRLCVESLFGAINLGIARDTVDGSKERVKQYRHLDFKTIILALGINDLPKDTETIVRDYGLLLDGLPETAFVIVSSVLPVDEETFNVSREKKKKNSQVEELNKALLKLSETRENVTFINSGKYLTSPTGSLQTIHHLGDGLHLNQEGYELWVKGMREEFEKLVGQGRGGESLRRAALSSPASG